MSQHNKSKPKNIVFKVSGIRIFGIKSVFLLDLRSDIFVFLKFDISFLSFSFFFFLTFVEFRQGPGFLRLWSVGDPNFMVLIPSSCPI